jgi:Ring finger domain
MSSDSKSDGLSDRPKRTTDDELIANALAFIKWLFPIIKAMNEMINLKGEIIQERDESIRDKALVIQELFSLCNEFTLESKYLNKRIVLLEEVVDRMNVVNGDMFELLNSQDEEINELRDSRRTPPPPEPPDDSDEIKEIEETEAYIAEMNSFINNHSINNHSSHSSVPFVRCNEPSINNTDECSICYDPFVSRDNVVLNCGHHFHFSCLRQCVENICPICRAVF